VYRLRLAHLLEHVEEGYLVKGASEQYRFAHRDNLGWHSEEHAPWIPSTKTHECAVQERDARLYFLIVEARLELRYFFCARSERSVPRHRVKSHGYPHGRGRERPKHLIGKAETVASKL
jgi:uncharacterized C2H2 Zn-finger protein